MTKVWITGGWKSLLEEAEATKVTEHTVTVNGYRQHITSNYGRVFFSRDEAITWLTQQATESIKNAEKRLADAKERFQKVQELNK